MEENEENVYLEDAMDGVMSRCIDRANEVQPESEEHVTLVSEINSLYNTKAKYAEVEMKYEAEEEQRKMDYHLKSREMDLKERELNLKQAELNQQKKTTLTNNIFRGVETGVKATGMAAVVCLMAKNIQAEYVDMRSVTGGPFRALLNCSTKWFGF